MGGWQAGAWTGLDSSPLSLSPFTSLPPLPTWLPATFSLFLSWLHHSLSLSKALGVSVEPRDSPCPNLQPGMGTSEQECVCCGRGGGGVERGGQEPEREVLKDALALEKAAELQPWGGVQGPR